LCETTTPCGKHKCSTSCVRFIKGTNPAPLEKIKVKAQKGEDLEEVTNPVFELWKAQEQQVLSYLLTSVSRDVLVHIAVLPTATAV
jgi:hypothetical protein